MRSSLVLAFSLMISFGFAAQAQNRTGSKSTTPQKSAPAAPVQDNSKAKNTSAPAQKPGAATTKGPEKLAVPVNVLETFYAKYQKTKEVVWKQVEKEFVVNFKLGEHPLEATFAEDGQWLHTTQNISVNQLPREIISRFAKQPTFKMKSAVKAESYQRGIVFEVTALKDGQTLQLVFLPGGRLVSGDGL